MGARVGVSVGARVGARVGSAVGVRVGARVGAGVGTLISTVKPLSQLHFDDVPAVIFIRLLHKSIALFVQEIQ